MAQRHSPVLAICFTLWCLSLSTAGLVVLPHTVQFVEQEDPQLKPHALWESQAAEDKWYGDVAAFWDDRAAAVGNMIEEGPSRNSVPDLQESLEFLQEFFPQGRQGRRALDVGAGIGRAAKGLLLKLVWTVDLVDQSAAFTRAAKGALGPQGLHRSASAPLNPGGEYYMMRVQDFVPKPAAYDLISLHWMALYLSDQDLLQLLTTLKGALKPNGLLFLKDSLAPDDADQAVLDDSRILRTAKFYKGLLQRAGLHVVKHGHQTLEPLLHTNRVGLFLAGSDKVHYIPDPEDPNVLLPLMGTDSHTGEHYHSLSNLWNSDASVKDWEDKNVKYWNERQANVNNPEIAAVDLRESDAFLKPAFPGGQRWTRRGLDLGAGVGRVSQGVLLNYVYTVDLVDTGAHFLREAKRRLSTRNLHGKYIQSSVQDASIDANTYDLVCLQYTALYIPDDELIGVLRKASAGLKPGGIIFVKDNLPINPAKFQVNRDSGLNIFRTEPHYNWLYKSAGLKIIARQQQQEWIPDANPVLMWQLKPE